MSKISKYDRKRGIIPAKPNIGPQSKLPSMTERAFLIYKHSQLLPELAKLIAEYASPSYREIINYFCDKAETTVGDCIMMNNKVKCPQGSVDFIKHKGRKPNKREFYLNPRIEFYIFDRKKSGNETFYINKEYFITSLETEVWFLPTNEKIKINEGLLEQIKLWLNGIIPFD